MISAAWGGANWLLAALLRLGVRPSWVTRVAARSSRATGLRWASAESPGEAAGTGCGLGLPGEGSSRCRDGGAASPDFSHGLRAVCSGELPTRVTQPGASPPRDTKAEHCKGVTAAVQKTKGVKRGIKVKTGPHLPSASSSLLWPYCFPNIPHPLNSCFFILFLKIALFSPHVASHLVISSLHL